MEVVAKFEGKMAMKSIQLSTRFLPELSLDMKHPATALGIEICQGPPGAVRVKRRCWIMPILCEHAPRGLMQRRKSRYSSKRAVDADEKPPNPSRGRRGWGRESCCKG